MSVAKAGEIFFFRTVGGAHPCIVVSQQKFNLGNYVTVVPVTSTHRD